jgi:hypothetical protein
LAFVGKQFEEEVHVKLVFSSGRCIAYHLLEQYDSKTRIVPMVLFSAKKWKGAEK